MTVARSLKYVRRALFYGAIATIVLFYLFPTLWIVSTSFKNPVEYFSYPPRWIPAHPTLVHYQLMFTEYEVGAAVRNSVVISVINTAVVLLLSIPVAYAIGRYKIGGEALSFWIISQRMLPAVAIVIPLFLICRSLHLINTYQGLIIAYALFLTPFALIDGCSEVQSILKIVLPILSGGIFVVALLVFVFTWNDLLIAIVLTRSETRTIMAFFTAALVSPTQEDFGVAAGAVVIGLIPAYLFTLFGQRFLVRGLTMGGVKG